MTRTPTRSWTRRAQALCLLGVLAASSSCSSGADDAAGRPAPGAPTSVTTGGSTVGPTSPTPAAGRSCGFPASSVQRIATRWRAVATAPDERAARGAAVRYRDAIGRVRASFAVACPDLEETFNQVFVDAQFLVEDTGTGDVLELSEVVRNAETLVAALGLQDRVVFVEPDPTGR